MRIHPDIIAVLWAAVAAVIAWYAAEGAQRITYVTLADGSRQTRQLPLLFRWLMPWTGNVAGLTGHARFATERGRNAARLAAAGLDDLLTPRDLAALRILFPLVYGTLWAVLLWPLTRMAGNAVLDRLFPVALLAAVAILPLYPSLWLQKAVRLRHAGIRRALPFMLDLLTLSVEAGMDFMTALQRGTERSIARNAVDPLAEELIRVVREIQMGKTRREALRDMARRVNQPDLNSVINALVQADELGVSIGAILRIQSAQIRQRRFEHAEKLANEAPIKMLFPLIACFFPAVFIILLGPVLSRIAQQGF